MNGNPTARQLAVLDIEQGVARLMGNRAVYFNALRRFAAHVDTARTVMAQLAAGDHAAAYRTVHTLKGSAGLLCAAEVQAIAAEVETALEQGHLEQRLMDELGAALRRLGLAIDAATPEDIATAVAFVPPPPIGGVRELLDRLQALFDEGNGAAIDLLDQYGTVLEKALGSAAWQSIEAAARDCDFECALVALRDARLTAAR